MRSLDKKKVGKKLYPKEKRVADISFSKSHTRALLIEKPNFLLLFVVFVSYKNRLNHADDDRNFVDVNVLLSDAVKTGGMLKSHHVFGTSSTSSSSSPLRNHEKHIIIIIIIIIE